jgi:predicted kinase
VVDASFLEASRREPFRELARSLRVPYAIASCAAPDAALRDRIAARAARGDDASEAGPEVLAHKQRGLEPLPQAERAAVVGIDTADESRSRAGLAELLRRLNG